MPKYIIRVVLHNASDPEDYDGLHEKMEESGYYRTITGDSGATYQLPSATYSAKKAAMRASTVRAEVIQIVNASGFRNSILVTRSTESAWRGLKKVDET